MSKKSVISPKKRAMAINKNGPEKLKKKTFFHIKLILIILVLLLILISGFLVYLYFSQPQTWVNLEESGELGTIGGLKNFVYSFMGLENDFGASYIIASYNEIFVPTLAWANRQSGSYEEVAEKINSSDDVIIPVDYVSNEGGDHQVAITGWNDILPYEAVIDSIIANVEIDDSLNGANTTFEVNGQTCGNCFSIETIGVFSCNLTEQCGINSVVAFMTMDFRTNVGDSDGNPQAKTDEDYIWLDIDYHYEPFLKFKTLDNENFIAKTSFGLGEVLFINGTIIHGDGNSYLDGATIEIIDSNDDVVNSGLMNQGDSIMNGYVYDYSYSIPVGASLGDWKIRITSSDTANNIQTFENSFKVFKFGYLNVTLTSPLNSPIDLGYQKLLTIDSEIKCEGDVGAVCMDVFSFLRYNTVGNEPDSFVNSNFGAIPFYMFNTKAVGEPLSGDFLLNSGKSYHEGLAIDPRDNGFWITARSIRQAIHYDRFGNELGRFSLTILGNSGDSIAFDSRDNTLWVHGASRNRVYNMDTSGNLLGKSFFANAQGLDFDSKDNTFWYCDYSNIYNINENGVIISSFDISSFAACRALSVDSRDDTLWITDSSNNRVRHLTKNGILLPEGFSYSNNYDFGLDLDNSSEIIWITFGIGNEGTNTPFSSGKKNPLYKSALNQGEIWSPSFVVNLTSNQFANPSLDIFTNSKNSFVGYDDTDNVLLSVKVPEFIAPKIDYDPTTTPAITNQDNIFVNVTSSDEGRGDSNISTFIDFNNSLIGWWRMDEDISCYQETVNQNHPNDGFCNLNYTGTNSNSGTYFYSSYAKPLGFDFSSIWQVKTGSLVTNLSIPQTCWDYNPDNLYLVVTSWKYNVSTFYLGRIRAYCRDSGGYVELYDNQEIAGGATSCPQDPNLAFDGDDSTAVYYDTTTTPDRYCSCLGGNCMGFALSEENMIWKFNAPDSSIYKNHGSVTGDLIKGDGKMGQAMEFDGNGDYVNLGDLDLNDQFTMSFWVKSKELGGREYLISKRDYAASEFAYTSWMAPEGFTFFISPSGDSTNSRSVFSGDLDIYPNLWYQVVSTFNGTDLKLYINGNEADSTSGPLISIIDNDLDTYIGHLISGELDKSLNGSIDDVMIFDRALSEKEVLALYANTTSKYLAQNFAGLSEGDYTFTSYSQDTSGNVNETLERSVEVVIGSCSDGAVRSCGSNVGECIIGTETCSGGVWPGTCVGEVTPVAEVCDDLDNDCDGIIDEGLTRPTTCGVGQCNESTGLEICDAGIWGSDTCDPFAGASLDNNCDNSDNDCDGSVDEDYVIIVTNCGVGECSGNSGNMVCVSGVEQNTCNPLAGAVTETCEDDTGYDGLDNNCDGQTDLNCDSYCDADNDGYSSHAICFFAGYSLGDCEPENINVNPGANEVCNSVDDDCDGGTSDGVDEPWYNDVTTCGTGVCESNGNLLCTDGSQDNTCSPGISGTETCNNQDDDCDGTTDEDLTQITTCGLGECAGNLGEETCDAGVWVGDDCNPFEGAISEICNNQDDDCDGTTDEDLTQITTCGTGECSGNLGEETCFEGGWIGDTCDPFFGNSTEACDGILDENCNGIIDDGCECIGSEIRICGTDVGQCSFGIETCSGGVWPGTCVGGVTPVAEVCDNQDNNCDGIIDEGLTRPTTCGVGQCNESTGLETCDAGIWGSDTCDAYLGNTTEVCDGVVDEDCDGVVDEDCGCNDGDTRACGNDTGECQTGLETCFGGVWDGICIGESIPTIEICDNLDNNCDGIIDEDNLGNNLTINCYGGPDLTQGFGICIAGIQTCSNGEYGLCSGEILPEVNETCEGSIDEDCDLSIDEGCACINGAVKPCGSDVGECAFGNQTCVDGNWSVCLSGIMPQIEICDNLDNNCDGNIDESLTQTTTCGVGKCSGNLGEETCNAGNWTGDTCNPFQGAVGEICNDQDDDCDGSIDEGLNCDSSSSSSSSSSGSSGGPPLSGNVTLKANFEVDYNELKIPIRQGGVVHKNITVKNNLAYPMNFTVSSQNLESFLLIKDLRFSLGANESRIVELKFFANEDQSPEVYTGNIQINSTYWGGHVINVILEVSEVYTDVDLSVIIPQESKNIGIGQELEVLINMDDLAESINPRTGIVSVYLADLNKVILEQIETFDTELGLNIVLEKKYLISETFESGNYLILVRLEYEDSFIERADSFIINNEEYPKRSLRYLRTAIILMILALIIFIILLTYNKNNLEDSKNKNITKSHSDKILKPRIKHSK